MNKAVTFTVNNAANVTSRTKTDMLHQVSGTSDSDIFRTECPEEKMTIECMGLEK